MWNLDSDRPIYVQLVERLQIQIVSGQYAPGQKLPSVRELAAVAAVNPNTMQKAFAELEGSGLVVTQSTSGRMVTEDSDLIRNTRKRMAIQKAEQFFSGMKELGFAKEEAMALLEERL
ncbi:MAG: GntR family transcriptional regulator [Lachnospiraceae bacterium]|jgi:GntR family transcriptional regulator|nr:GntR family transcriptional regulator [Lachnospiraceae bacterium]